MTEKATRSQVLKLLVLMKMHMIDRKEFKKRLQIESTKDLSKEEISTYIDYYENIPTLL